MLANILHYLGWINDEIYMINDHIRSHPEEWITTSYLENVRLKIKFTGFGGDYSLVSPMIYKLTFWENSVIKKAHTIAERLLEEQEKNRQKLSLKKNKEFDLLRREFYNKHFKKQSNKLLNGDTK